MPTYDYTCPRGHEFEKFYSKISDATSETPCPECGATAVRQISGGAGLLFKGSGFYLTDYGKNAHRGEKKAGEGAGASGEPKAGEPKAGESKAGDSKSGEPKSGESKSGASKSGESKSAGDRGVGKADAAKPAAKPAEGKSTGRSDAPKKKGD